jgi:hypothetical protein
VIIAWDKTFFNVLRMRDIRAGRLKPLKMKDFNLPATIAVASDQTGFGCSASS